jgi:hypothetical protein
VYTYLILSRFVNRGIPNLPNIEVRSTLCIRLVSTLETILSSFLANEGMREAWRSGCREADMENMRIKAEELPIVRSERCPIVDHTGRHICQGCLQGHKCSDFEFVARVNAQLCPSCQIALPSIIDRELVYSTRPDDENLRLRTRLRVVAKEDDNKFGYGMAVGVRNEQVEKIIEQLLEKYGLEKEPGVCYKFNDGYVSQVLLDQGMQPYLLIKIKHHCLLHTQMQDLQTLIAKRLAHLLPRSTQSSHSCLTR